MNLADGLRINSWSNPDKVAAVFEDKQVTYEQLNKQANRLAHALLKKGFKRQDKISIIMYNNIEFLEIYHGLARAARPVAGRHGLQHSSGFDGPQLRNPGMVRAQRDHA